MLAIHIDTLVGCLNWCYQLSQLLALDCCIATVTPVVAWWGKQLFPLRCKETESNSNSLPHLVALMRLSILHFHITISWMQSSGSSPGTLWCMFVPGAIHWVFGSNISSFPRILSASAGTHQSVAKHHPVCFPWYAELPNPVRCLVWSKWCSFPWQPWWQLNTNPGTIPGSVIE